MTTTTKSYALPSVLTYDDVRAVSPALEHYTYRHQLVASPAYLEKCKPPRSPRDLLGHRLLAFSFWKPENTWHFTHANGKDKETLTFQPYLSINEYSGLATALLAGTG